MNFKNLVSGHFAAEAWRARENPFWLKCAGVSLHVVPTKGGGFNINAKAQQYRHGYYPVAARYVRPNASKRVFCNAVMRCVTDIRAHKRLRDARESLFASLESRDIDVDALPANRVDTYCDMSLEDVRFWFNWFKKDHC